MANIFDVSAALKQADPVAAFQEGRQFAQQNQQNSNLLQKQQQSMQDQGNLRALAPQVIAGDPNAYAQAAAIDPQAANQYQASADDQLRRLQGSITYLDQQKDPRAKEAAYQQQVRPYLARFGKEPPATFAEAEPLMEAARARIAELAQPKGAGLINVGAGGAVFDPATRQLVYQNPGVAKAPGIVAVNLPDGTTQQFQQLPDGSLAPLRIAGQGSPQAASQGAGTPDASDPMTAFIAQANQAVSSGVATPAQAEEWLRQKAQEVTAQAQQSPAGLGRSAPKQTKEDEESFGAPQQVVDAQGNPHLVQFGNRGGQREVSGLTKPDMTPAQAAKAAVQQQKAEASKTDAVDAYDQSIDQINQLLNSPGVSMLGTFSGDVAGMVPHSDTANANSRLDVIKNQVLLNTIAKLKSLSATGASGFGSLSNQEGEILKNSIAALDKKQSNGQLIDNLHQIRSALKRSRDNIAGKQVIFDEGGSKAPPSDAGGWSIQKVQ